MTCEPPAPPLPQYIFSSVRKSSSKKFSFVIGASISISRDIRCLLNAGYFYCYTEFYVHLKIYFFYLSVFKENNFSAHSEYVKIQSFFISILNSPISRPTYTVCEQLFNIFWIVFLAIMGEVKFCI